MSDETVAALQEIAGLLRRRVEQQDEQARRSEELHKQSEERFAEMDVFKSEMPDLPKMQQDSENLMEEFRQEVEQRRAGEKREKERLQEEDRQFKQRLLAELERHNTAIEHLLARLERGQ